MLSISVMYFKMSNFPSERVGREALKFLLGIVEIHNIIIKTVAAK